MIIPLDLNTLLIKLKPCLVQICSYVTTQINAQFYTHIFFMLIFPSYACILIWDRAGVTTLMEKIDLETNASVLAEFFWRYQNMSCTKPGYNETVWLVSATDIKQTVFNALEILEVDHNAHLLEMLFPGGRKFIIYAQLCMGTASPTSWLICTFKVLCMQTMKIVFLKDTWHVISDGLLSDHISICKASRSRDSLSCYTGSFQ